MAVQLNQTARATAYVLGALPVGLAILIGLPLGLGLGLGLSPVFIGVPFLALTLLAWRRLASFERRRAAVVLGTPIPEPVHREHMVEGFWARWRERVKDGGTWRELGYTVLLGTLGFLAALALTALAASAFALFALAFLAPGAREGTVLEEWPLPWLLGPVGGVLMLGATALAARVFAAGLLRAAQGLLRPDESARLRERVDTLEVSRAGAVDSADATLRRIERDLHDGAQHRLAYVAMELGRAREKLDEDPEAARELIDRAHDQSKRAMGELRDLVRGVHPSVLADRGLEAAVPGLAGRSTVPVTVRVEVEPRPGRATETAAYFVVAESLANVGKHAAATSARVDVVRFGDRLTVEVVDDGAGGAELQPGGGLAGLAQRVEALDGTFELRSPAGQGTRIRVELPA